MRSICERMNGGHSSKRITQLTAKRNRKIEDYLHKTSKKVIEICDRHEISTLVIGQNKGWKQEVSLGKKTNQHFVQIPFARFIQMLQYKAESAGIQVILTEAARLFSTMSVRPKNSTIKPGVMAQKFAAAAHMTLDGGYSSNKENILTPVA